ncbi:MAG: signal peptide peptidase SppA [Candidatus Altiarchaeia archaeon]
MTLRSGKTVKKEQKKTNAGRGKILLVLVVFGCLLLAVALVALLFGGMKIAQLPIVGQKVAIIPIKGEITAEGCSASLFSSASCVNVAAIKEVLKAADKDDSIRAVVLDINSGGGSVVPSRELAYVVRDMKKPVVACIRETGASGAYYIASASDHIVADRDSMTGSIGVIMTIQHMYGLYEKLGINVTVIKSGKVKDIGSPYREMTPEENAELTDMVDKIYEDFVSDVALNRNMSVEYVKSISDGSIYLGREAMDLGLVDSLGTIDDAVAIAADLGDIQGEPAIQKTASRPLTIWDYLSQS